MHTQRHAYATAHTPNSSTPSNTHMRHHAYRVRIGYLAAHVTALTDERPVFFLHISGRCSRAMGISAAAVRFRRPLKYLQRPVFVGCRNGCLSKWIRNEARMEMPTHAPSKHSATGVTSVSHRALPRQRAAPSAAQPCSYRAHSLSMCATRCCDDRPGGADIHSRSCPATHARCTARAICEHCIYTIYNQGMSNGIATRG